MSAILTLHNPGVARRYYDAGWWRSDTLYALLERNAAVRPDRHALRDSYRRLTWSALKARVDRFAAVLHSQGLRPGDRVAVWLPNRVETIVATLACSRNGYICNPSLHQSYGVDDVVGLLRGVGARALVAQAGFGADARERDIFVAAREVGSLLAIHRLDPAEVDRDGFPDREGAAAPSPQTDPDKVVLLAFTSGTTGEPKGVMHSDNTLLANARAMAAAWHHREDMVLLCLSPLTHAIGTIAMAQSLVSGFELVLNDPVTARRPFDWVLESEATYVMGVPTHAIDLLAEMRRRGLERLGEVSIFYLGGTSIPRSTAQALLAVGITPQNVYGMTENGAHHYTRPDDDADTIAETCGRDCGCYEVRLWDPADPEREAPRGEVGEIGGRGACLMLGYFGDQRATEGAVNAGGWFMSGDLGRIDERGNLRIVGRKKDIIIRGGRNIYPARIEDAARGHPDIVHCAAFAVADERLGEKVAVAVVLRDGRTMAAERVLDHLSANGVSPFDMPEYFVQLPALPATPSGKVLKRKLVEMAAAGRLQLQAVRYRRPG